MCNCLLLLGMYSDSGRHPTGIQCGVDKWEFMNRFKVPTSSSNTSPKRVLSTIDDLFGNVAQVFRFPGHASSENVSHVASLTLDSAEILKTNWKDKVVSDDFFSSKTVLYKGTVAGTATV